MKIELTQEEISHLNSLDSKKKKRKFLIDCFINSFEVEEPAINLNDFLKNQIRIPWEYLKEPKEIKNNFSEMLEKLQKGEVDMYCFINNIESKYKKQGPVLTGNQIIDSVNTGIRALDSIRKVYKAIEKKEIIENSKKPQPPMEFCVEITDENKEVLQQIWAKRGQAVVGNYLLTNSLNTFLIQNDEPFLWIEDFGKKQLPTVTTEQFLRYIGKENLIENGLK
jgi:hypothetical protein